MVELAIRIVLALGVSGLALAQHLPQESAVFKLTAVFIAASVLLFQLERKKMRTEAVSTVAACLDAVAVATALGLVGQLELFGFMVLLPIANAASRFGSVPATMAPIAFGSIIASHMYFSNAASPSQFLLAQAAGVLGLGMLLNDRKLIQTVAKPVLPEHTEPTQGDPQEVLDLRESFRRLQDMYRDLDQRARRDHNAASLAQLESDGTDTYLFELATKIRESSGASSIAILVRNELDDELTVRSWSGPMDAKLKTSSFEFKTGQSASQISVEIHDQVAELIAPSAMKHQNFALRSGEKLVGAILVFGREAAQVSEAIDYVRESSEVLVKSLSSHYRCQKQELRMREAEVAYGLASVLDGSASPKAAATRALREIFPALGIDHLAVHWISETGPRISTCEGKETDFLAKIRFSKGEGYEGWMELGAPEVIMPDVYEDSRCPSSHATKERISSFAIVPILQGEAPCGYLTAASQRPDGIDPDVVDTLRRLAGEMSNAIERMETYGSESFGICSPSELQEAASQCKRGYLVHLEPFKKKSLLDQVGRPNFDAAIQQLTRQIRGKLPAGSLITRRQEGDFVVLLKNVSNEFAVSWANEAAATASFIGVRLPFSEARIPLALKAKVAKVSQQNDLVSA